MAEPAPAADRAALLGAIAEALAAAGVAPGPAGLTPATTLDRDVGLDSFQLMQVARHLERRFGYAFSVADWALTQDAGEGPGWTAGSLADFMARALARPGA